MDDNGSCQGCTTSSEVELPWAGSVLRSLGGLIATQALALTALVLLSFRPRRRWMVTILSVIALTFAFFDILAQVPQGLYYNIDSMTYETSIDLVDFMLLMRMKLDAGQPLLKGLLLVTAVLYSFAFVWFYRRTRRGIRPGESSLISAQDEVQPPVGNAWRVMCFFRVRLSAWRE